MERQALVQIRISLYSPCASLRHILLAPRTHTIVRSRHWLRLARSSSVGIQGFNKLQQKMLQTSDTVEARGIPVVPLSFDLIYSTLDISEPPSEDIAIVDVVRVLAHAFLSAVVLRSVFVDGFVA